jgi:hypothetical protein
MIFTEAKMSTNDSEPEENKKKQKQYMWLGFGNYPGGGIQGPINPGNVRADVSIFDKLFELFGVKDKPKKEAEETVKPK